MNALPQPVVQHDLPVAEAALADAVLRALNHGRMGQGLAALCHATGLTISHLPRQEQDAVLDLVQSRIAAELRAQQSARDWLAQNTKRSA